IKTKFPVARIKRIMQADEDVGKVAQVTPVIVSKALELFMIALCEKASQQARSRNSKRITASHLKQAVMADEQFDFLEDIMAKVPDVSLP
ncbi:histone-fold-containing protein, partial [Terfezia boudieri ATCC MYA-4762]